MTEGHSGPLAAAVWQALGTVLDPELDEPITTLDFVASWSVDRDGGVSVTLRLPTFYCAPNFSFLMVADAYDAVRAVPGVSAVQVGLADHHASAEINEGVAAHAGFAQTFTGQATGELHDLRAVFLRKAALAGQDRLARPLVDEGVTPAELAALTLGMVPDSVELRRLRQRRAALGLPADDGAPLLLDVDSGLPVPVEKVPLHLRRARLTRTGIEVNGEHCRALLATRYATPRQPVAIG